MHHSDASLPLPPTCCGAAGDGHPRQRQQQHLYSARGCSGARALAMRREQRCYHPLCSAQQPGGVGGSAMPERWCASLSHTSQICPTPHGDKHDQRVHARYDSVFIVFVTQMSDWIQHSRKQYDPPPPPR
jgi:hypothetical protein